MNASDLEKGKFFEYKGDVMQVVKKGVISVGTHSHTKLNLTVCDINGKKERDITLGHNEKVDILEITKKRANVISKSDDSLQIMDSMSYETLDAEAEKDVLGTIEIGDEVIYIDYKGVRVLGKRKL